jgi:murein DD-endopeptidase MepM/ murein hydrolase activator NlpD
MTNTRRLASIVGAIVLFALLSGFVVGTAVAAGGSAPTGKYDDAIAEANEERAKREAELKQMEQDLAHTDKAIIEATRKLVALEERLPVVQKEYELAQERLEAALLQQQIVADKLAAAEARDRAITAEIEKDQARVEELQTTVAGMARDSYKGAGNQASLSVVFGAQTSREFIDDYAIQHSASRAQANALAEMEQIASVNRNRGARQEAVRVYIEELKVIADELVVEAEAARKVAEEKKREVEELLQEARELREYLEAKRAEDLALQKQMESDQKSLERELQELIRKKIEEEGPPNPTPIGKGYLAFPTANPYITSKYGLRNIGYYGYRKFHYGTDFRAYCGTPIYASASGKVQWAKWNGGFGNHVLIDHGWVNGNVLTTSYAHFSKFKVSSGQQVRQGDLLGYSGSTGNSAACHLHYEVHVNGKTVDPMSLLGPIP